MAYPAEKIDSIFESESSYDHETDCEVVQFDFRQRDSLSENFINEIESWAMHCLASNGFGDY
jgi:hypothetical protein